MNANTKHGHCPKAKRSITYSSWRDMRTRCENKNTKSYYRYGGRGINICKRWLKFENFLEDMGEKPKDLSLDRVNNNKGYFKENCRWATRSEQCRNRRTSRLIKYKGETKTLAFWAEKFNLKSETLRMRIDEGGWTIKKALTTPTRKQKLLEFKGTKDTLMGWALKTGFNINVLAGRLRLGWSVKKALTTPVRHKK